MAEYPSKELTRASKGVGLVKEVRKAGLVNIGTMTVTDQREEGQGVVEQADHGLLQVSTGELQHGLDTASWAVQGELGEVREDDGQEGLQPGREDDGDHFLHEIAKLRADHQRERAIVPVRREEMM